MAQGARQSSLFAAEDFSVVYESFSEANFQAYDYETIRNSMVEYINNNYPENFNDWITSSEFVSLIELMAFLGHNLAFRADLASRENYLSTAERRESALRIAEFLGYTPTRNIVANGYLKIDSVTTNESVYDVDGRSLANTTILFEDSTDPDNYQNFLTVMNSMFQSNSQFGAPFSKFTINGITNEIYRTNSTSNTNDKNFTGFINGQGATFSMYSPSYESNTNTLGEKIPDPYTVIDLLYKNDNSGFSSPDTGFYIGFKQGSLEFQDFDIANGLPNLAIDINVNNISNGNVWVQTIDEAGQVLKTWTRVDKLYGQSSIFNASQNGVRDIYTIASRENDQISIVFADGQFGNVPRGIIRVWYRTGLNQTYNLNPDTFGNSQLTFDYLGKDGNTYRARLKMSLKSNVSNSSERESLDSIKANAGRFFATQDRMVTADDYSIFPITVSENIRKIKSVNRVHSGHSRFRDIYDPTATYSDATNYLSDGYLYEDNVTTRSIVNSDGRLTGEQIYTKYIKPQLSNPEIKNFFYNRHSYSGTFDPRTQYTDSTAGVHVYNSNGTDTDTFRWNQVTRGSNTSTGYITYNAFVQRMGSAATNSLSKAQVNGLVEFIASPYKKGYINQINIVSGGSGYTGVPTVTISGAGTGATATANVQAGVVVSISITDSGQNYTDATAITISGGGGSGASASAVIASAETQWARISALYKDGLGRDDATGRPTGVDQSGKGSVVLNAVIPSGSRINRLIPSWNPDVSDSVKTNIVNKINSGVGFGLRYNAASQTWVVIDNANLAASNITNNSVAQWSRQYEGDNTSTGRDNSWILRVNYTSNYWEFLTRKSRFVFGSDATVKFNNLNFAETFSSETSKPLRDSVTVLDINTKSTTDLHPLGENYKFNAYGYYTYTDGYTDPHKIRVTLADPDNDGYPNDPEAFVKVVGSDTIKLGTITENGYDFTVQDNANGTSTVTGRGNLRTDYTRIADINQVIDPATTNIIDTYVLLRSYDNDYRAWATYDGRPQTKPNAPTVNELGSMFNSLNTKKSISDQVIYRPVKYKILFGDLASSELQARFNVTKTANSSMSDSEIQSQVIRLISQYFSVDNWDFGEEFYFTELAAFIHNNMIGQISQVTIQPVSKNLKTVDLFEISADSDELFLPVLSSSNVVVTGTTVTNPTSIASNSGVSIQ
jgi:hypothetical protein